MRSHCWKPLALSVLVAVPVTLAGCHKKASSGSDDSVDPEPTSETVVNGEDGGAAPTPASGGGGHKGRAKVGDSGDSGAALATAALIINKPTVDPILSPALKKAPSVPPLPNLPAPSKYPKATAIPKTADIEECGSVWSGEEYVPVECIDPDVHGKDPKAAKVVIPYDKMVAPIEVLPKVVDHRLDGTEGIVRKQSGPQCTAFAFTSALDHAYARWTGAPATFSVMQVWARYHLKAEHAAADANIGDVLGNEADWPYDAKEANSWLKCKKDAKDATSCAKSPDEKKLKDLSSKAVAELTQIEVVPLTQLDVLREKIAGGQDVTVAVKLPSFATAGEAGAKYVIGVPKNKPDAVPKGAHQILLSGYAMTPNGTYYLVHNSWGPKWGDGGYAWLHEDFLKAFWVDKIMVIPDVQPKEVAELRAHAHGHLSARCGEGKAPDSISGLCASKCPDGSPRHNNACAREDKDKDRSADCPNGMVNLIGECVMAAPRSSGSDSASKVKWDCGPGGCVYTIPRDKLECKEKECEVSCPAPDFRLATTQKGIVCVE